MLRANHIDCFARSSTPTLVQVDTAFKTHKFIYSVNMRLSRHFTPLLVISANALGGGIVESELNFKRDRR